MQISAANLLALADAGAKPAHRQAKDGFAAALEEKSDGFQPLQFKTAAKPAEQAAAAPGPAKLGSQIDITV
jgi:hypothetical protein